MSTPPTSASGHAASSTPATTAARANGAPAGSARQGGSGADLFAGLLSLLSASPALPAGSDATDSAGLLQQAGDSAPGDDNAEPPALGHGKGNGTAWGINEHPLAALLAWSNTPSAWSSLPALGGSAGGSAAGAGSAAQGAAGGPAADGGAAWPGSGLQGGLAGSGASAEATGLGAASPDQGAQAAGGTSAATPPGAPQNAAAASAAAAFAGGPPTQPAGSPLPAGMTALPQAAPLSADAAAALAREGATGLADKLPAGTPGASSDSAATPAGAAPRAAGGWRSTTSIAQHPSTPSLQTPSGGAASHAASHHVALAAGVLPAAGLAEPGAGTRARSTVLLDDRFAAGSASPGLGSAAGSELSAPGAGTGQTGGGQAGSDSRSDTGNGPASFGSAGPDAAEMERSLTEANEAQEAQQEAALAAEQDEGLAPNLPQNLRQASLRVGDGGDDAIDIRLSLSGEQLSVDFRTDDPNTRDRLQDEAGDALGELLQRSGLQLGGVSVGSQTLSQDGGRGQPPPGGAGSGAQRAPASAGTVAAVDPAGAAGTAPRPGPRSDGSQPLDLFV